MKLVALNTEEMGMDPLIQSNLTAETSCCKQANTGQLSNFFICNSVCTYVIL